MIMNGNIAIYENSDTYILKKIRNLVALVHKPKTCLPMLPQKFALRLPKLCFKDKTEMLHFEIQNDSG